MKNAVRSLCISAALGLLAGCSMFDYSSIVSRRFALVYGVTMYVYAAGRSSPNLGYPAADASAVAAMLTSQGYAVTSRWVDADGYIFVNGANVAQISDAGLPNANAPSRATIQNDLASLKGQVGPNDVVVFYFSGHGMTDGRNEWFVPYGGVDPATGFGDKLMSIEDNEFGAMLDVLGTPRKVVILDTCNSGGFIGNTLEVDIVPQSSGGGLHIVTPVTIARAIANYFSFQGSSNGISPYGEATVISAAGAAESCYETDTLGSRTIDHGVMTYYLLQAADSGDLNGDGHVTALEAFSLVKAGIDTNWNGDSGVQAAGEEFEPHVSGGPVDFVIF
jgi:hypothetical protein